MSSPSRLLTRRFRCIRRSDLAFLESAYEECLSYELAQRSIEHKRQVGMPLIYKGLKLDVGYRIDLLVASCVIVEVKAIESLLPIHQAQLMTYLKLTEHRLGFLMNFNVRLFKDGVRRGLVNFAGALRAPVLSQQTNRAWLWYTSGLVPFVCLVVQSSFLQNVNPQNPRQMRRCRINFDCYSPARFSAFRRDQMASAPQTYKKGSQDIRENVASLALFWRLTKWSIVLIALTMIFLAYFFT